MTFLIVGTGFSGAVHARSLAEAGYKVLVIDERSHIGGNCHTERDPLTGVMVHKYGPHIFHTDKEHVWNYIRRFGEMVPYTNRVKAIARGRVFTLPINLLTINTLFNRTFSPDEAKSFINSIRVQFNHDPANFEEKALSLFGREIYEYFFYGYTKKQWGCDPRDLPASILTRLPVRFNYDDNYFFHEFQGMPKEGYTSIIKNILQHRNIEVRLDCKCEEISDRFVHTFYSGPLDRYFKFKLGRLGYRSLSFEAERYNGDYQGTAVVNYCDEEVPFTRISEHKHFSPWENDIVEGSIYFREYSKFCGPDDIPYYPIRLVEEKRMLSQYIEIAEQSNGVTFIGRLGTYRYLDMDVCIDEAMNASASVLGLLKEHRPLPAFFHRPL